jgi:hypothetical protein
MLRHLTCTITQALAMYLTAHKEAPAELSPSLRTIVLSNAAACCIKLSRWDQAKTLAQEVSGGSRSCVDTCLKTVRQKNWSK